MLLSWIVIFFVTINDKKITNYDIIFVSFSLKKIKKSRFETFYLGSIYAWSRHYVSHACLLYTSDAADE